jgi:hypothetical protein
MPHVTVEPVDRFVWCARVHLGNGADQATLRIGRRRAEKAGLRILRRALRRQHRASAAYEAIP